MPCNSKFQVPSYLEARAVRVKPQHVHSPGADAAQQLSHTLHHERYGAQLHSPTSALRQGMLPEPRLEVRHHHTVDRVPHPGGGPTRPH
jgi:hypothetical protein